MKRSKQRLAVALLAGAMIFPVAGAKAFAVGQNIDNTLKTEYKTIAEAKEETTVEFIKSLKNISESEKQMLIKAENEKAPLYEEMNKLVDKIQNLENAVLREADPIFDEIFKIKKADEKLWDKLFSATHEKQAAVGTNMVEFISLSDVLNKNEKTILTEKQKKLDELYKKVDGYYKKAEKASEKETKAYNELQSKIVEINKSVQNIWDKIYK